MKKLFSLLFVLTLAATPALAHESTLSLTVDRGVPLHLSAPAASVFVANPNIADIQVMSPQEVMIFGKRTGETTFMATDDQGHTLSERAVSVTQDLSQLRRELDAAIPGNQIHTQAVPDGIVLTGTAKDASAVADAYKIAMRYMPSGGDIINRVQVTGSNQVEIRVRFAEVSRSVDNTLGFDWQNVGNVGGMVMGIATGSIVNATSSGSGTFNTGSTTGLFPRPNNSTLSQPNDAIGFQHLGKRFDIQGMIDALAQQGLITILAEPNLTAMSGETANFLAGGEFPVPVPQGNNTISITYKPYGVSLSFTPTIIGNNRINLHVRPEVSELTDAGAITIDNITVPALTTRKAETTVEVASGQSFAIAGLLDNNQAQTANEFPVLGDMPILGALFRSNHFQNNQSELIVIITPYIVHPSDQQLALPTDGMAPPNDAERLIGLRTTSGDPNARPQSGEPVAVSTSPSAATPAAPDAAPVTPVTQAPALAAPASATPQNPAPPTSLVLHPADGSKTPDGGIMVE